MTRDVKDRWIILRSLFFFKNHSWVREVASVRSNYDRLVKFMNFNTIESIVNGMRICYKND